MIVAPIVARDTDGVLYVFESVDQAEHSVELADVEAEEYTVYDSNGSPLIFRVMDPPNGVIRLEPAGTDPELEAFHRLLVEGLARRGDLAPPSSPTSDLIERVRASDASWLTRLGRRVRRRS